MKSEKFGWVDRVAIIGSVASLLGLGAALLSDGVSRPLRVILALPLVGSLLFLFRRPFVQRLKSLHAALERTAPWMLLATLCVTGTILLVVWPVKRAGVIRFEPEQGATFNSYDHVTNHTPYITAFGSTTNSLEWIIEADKRTAAFNYEADVKIKPSGLESSGAYLTFYENPFDRHGLRSICFECKATGFNGKPDIGLRLAVDDPHGAGDRELRTLEFSSLAVMGPIDAQWRKFRIHLSDFKETVRRPPFPRGLDANTVNKIVFFVNTHSASNCPKATLWFRDLSFEK